MENNTLYSWPVIIIALILFWPLGVFLIYKKSQTDKKTALTVAKILNILGTIFIVVGIITLIAIIGIFYLILGIVLKVLAKKMLASAENVKRYISIVINGNLRQLDAIAAAVGKPYDTVKADLQKLIDDGYFKNAYINEATREIVLSAPSASVNEVSASVAGTAVQTRVVVCPCCGANNTVSGAVGECEYCGSPLE